MTTYHAIQRTQERANLNLHRSLRFISNAINRGKSAEAFHSIEREYLLEKESKYGCVALVYNTFCFIVNDEDTCITMYSLPTWFGKKRNLYVGKERVKDKRRYKKFYYQPC